jgi:4-aminobutyrate aminotransferase
VLYQDDVKYNSRLQKLRFHPAALTGGKGCRVLDGSGRTLLDLSGAWGAASLGYGHPAFVAAITAAARNPAGASILSTANRPATQLAQRLLALTPGDDNRQVWLGHSGSDANEAIIRAVRAATGRSRIVSFIGSCHGGTAATIAISGHNVHAAADKDPKLALIPYPDSYRPFRGDVSGEEILDLFSSRLATDLPPSEVAAFFIEPIQSDGGMIVPPAGFLKGLSELCRANGILTVCDEVKVGLGRSGRMHCFEHHGFTPDIITFGKGLGGGLPISAAIGPLRIMDFASSFAMQTLHGNPICSSAAMAVLDTINSEALTANAENVGEYLKILLRDAARRSPFIGDVRGYGLAIGIELVTDRDSRNPASTIAAKTVYRCFELGLLIYYVGMNSNVLELTPPLVFTCREAEEAVQILAAALDDVAAGKVPDAAIESFEGW